MLNLATQGKVAAWHHMQRERQAPVAKVLSVLEKCFAIKICKKNGITGTFRIRL